MQWLGLLMIVCISVSCNTDKKKGVEVNFDFQPYYLGKIYLEKLPVNNERSRIIDSAEFDFKNNRLKFYIPSQEESVFQLRIPGKPLRIIFVNDVANINIQALNPDASRHRFNNTGINQSLSELQNKLQFVYQQIGLINETRETIKSTNHNFEKRIDSLQKQSEEIARAFADTVNSPGAFLFAYNKVNFENDREGLKSFITKAATRFQGHKAIQELYQNTITYLGIYEGELNIGDELPAISLPDNNDHLYASRLFKGKYVFIDLWSGWCNACLQFIAIKKSLSQKYSPDKLQLVSIAIEPEKEVWKYFIYQNQIPGKHLIDESVWLGESAKHWKFDSIPYNYLISPEGKILAKAIKADSVLTQLAKFIK